MYLVTYLLTPSVPPRLCSPVPGRTCRSCCYSRARLDNHWCSRMANDGELSTTYCSSSSSNSSYDINRQCRGAVGSGRPPTFSRTSAGIGVARRDARVHRGVEMPPRARIRSKFARFDCFKSCIYAHVLCIVFYAIFRR